MRKFLIYLVSIVGVTLLWFSPNIWGYFVFQGYCQKYGGLTVNGKVLPDQGWLADSKDSQGYRSPFFLGKVGFVRYENEKGEKFDVYGVPESGSYEPRYVFKPVDESKEVKYRLRYVNEKYPDEVRLGKTEINVLSAKTNELIIRYTVLVYGQFEQSRTLFNAPSATYCPTEPLNEKEESKLIFN